MFTIGNNTISMFVIIFSQVYICLRGRSEVIAACNHTRKFWKCVGSIIVIFLSLLISHRNIPGLGQVTIAKLSWHNMETLFSKIKLCFFFLIISHFTYEGSLPSPLIASIAEAIFTFCQIQGYFIKHSERSFPWPNIKFTYTYLLYSNAHQTFFLWGDNLQHLCYYIYFLLV